MGEPRVNVVNEAVTPPEQLFSAAALEALGTTWSKLHSFSARASYAEVPYTGIFPSHSGTPSPLQMVGLWGGLTEPDLVKLKNGAMVVRQEVDAPRYASWVGEYLKAIMASAKACGDRYWASLGGLIATLDKEKNTWDKYAKVLGQFLALEASEGNKWIRQLPTEFPRVGEGGQVSEVWVGMDFSIGECCQWFLILPSLADCALQAVGWLFLIDSWLLELTSSEEKGGERRLKHFLQCKACEWVSARGGGEGELVEKTNLASILTAISAIALFAKFAWASEHYEKLNSLMAGTLDLERDLQGHADQMRWGGKMDAGPMGNLFAIRRKLDQFSHLVVGHKLFRDKTADGIAFWITGTNQYISTKGLTLVVNAVGEQIVKGIGDLFGCIGPGVPALLLGDGAVDIDDSDSRIGASATIRWWVEGEGEGEGSGGVYSMSFMEKKLEEYLKAMTVEDAKKWLRGYLILLTRVNAFVLFFAETRGAQLQVTELEDGADGVRGSRFWNHTKSDCGCACVGGVATMKIKGKM